MPSRRCLEPRSRKKNLPVAPIFRMLAISGAAHTLFRRVLAPARSWISMYSIARRSARVTAALFPVTIPWSMNTAIGAFLGRNGRLRSDYGKTTDSLQVDPSAAADRGDSNSAYPTILPSAKYAPGEANL